MTLHSCAVIGLGLFGRQVARTLASLGVDVVAVDRDPALVEAVKDQVTSAVCADLTDEKALLESGVLQAEVAVVAIGEAMEASILVTALLHKHGVSQIVARSHSDLHAQVLTTVGATRTVDPEDEMGHRLAHELYAPDVHSRIRLSTGQEVVEFEAPKPFAGQTVQALQFREKYLLNILAIKHRAPEVEGGFRINRLPRPGDVIAAGDVIVAIGDETSVRKFMDLLG